MRKLELIGFNRHRIFLLLIHFLEALREPYQPLSARRCLFCTLTWMPEMCGVGGLGQHAQRLVAASEDEALRREKLGRANQLQAAPR